MGVSSTSIFTTTNFFCRFSSDSKPYSITSSHCQFNTNSLKKHKLRSIPFLKVPSLSYHSKAVFQISAGQHRRPPRRRRSNTLREKLAAADKEQVRKFSLLSEKADGFNLDSKVFDDVLDSKELDDLSGDSVLWAKLENWADQFKKDLDFHQNADENAIRVSEDEIAEIRGVRAQSFNEKDEIEESMDVNSKLDGPKLNAKHIEAGECTIEGNGYGIADRLRSVSFRHEPFLKAMPAIGFIVFCGFFVFWAVEKIVRKEKVELTREEAEMLRRKQKSRMARDESEKRKVEVLLRATELPMGSDTRPQLDRNELMRSIEQAKTSRESLVISDSNFSAKNDSFDAKVREIRQMARKVRELERRDRAQNDEEGEGDDLSSAMLASDSRSNNVVSSCHVESNSISEINNVSDHRKNIEPSVNTEKKRTVTEENGDYTSDIPVGEPSKSYDTNKDAINITADDHEVGAMRHSREVAIEGPAENTAGCSESNPLSVQSMRSEEESEQKEMVSVDRLEKDSNNISSSTSSSARNKPRIIRSIKEAREYLAEKRGISAEIMQSKQDMKFKSRVAGINAYGHPYDDKLAESPLSVNDVTHTSLLDDSGTGKMVRSSDSFRSDEAVNTVLRTPKIRGLNYEQETLETQTGCDSHIAFASDKKQPLESQGASYGKDSSSIGSSRRGKPDNIENIMHSSGEVSDLSNKGATDPIAPGRNFQDSVEVGNVSNDEPCGKKGWNAHNKMASLEESVSRKSGFDGDSSSLFPDGAGILGDIEPFTLNDARDDNEQDMKDPPISKTSFQLDSNGSEGQSGSLPSKLEKSQKSWAEENFQQFEPIIKKISTGFKENYMVAKEKVQDLPGVSSEISELGLVGDDEELEWMKDEKLREIVFQVRENELVGRDPFHLMDADDRDAFFKGLEHKAEKVNEKLLGLHEWVHSRIENLDYGADGISLNDSLDKIVPRWKGPAIDKDPEFLRKVSDYPKANFAGNKGISHVIKEETQKSLQQPEEAPNSTGGSYSPVMTPRGVSANPKTLIECSDSSRRPGRKTGKEHWQHTKKWSRGFMEVYNAETDPEIKSIMKDMGKDLDRWITEKETQDVADLMTRIPKRKRRYIEKKMEKIKREVEIYGPQAVVSKYREYADDREEDYLWWLDLQFVLCIELYTLEDGDPKIGLYSLEMAADLELNPKQYHVIAFEEPGDSKNFCYIVQAYMDTHGSGSAFVVARPPKDAFREAKANGFSITLIRKGEVKLNVDQTLEEVEEAISEIGSKVYHDKIMRERSVGIHTLMKGVVSAEKSTKRRSKRMLANAGKPRR